MLHMTFCNTWKLYYANSTDDNDKPQLFIMFDTETVKYYK